MKYPVKYNVMGVYALLRGKRVVYVGGSARCIYNRISFHMWGLRNGKHPSERLQMLWDEGGHDKFSWVVLERCPKSRVRLREAHWSRVHAKTILNTYPEGQFRKVTEETRASMRVGAARRVSRPGHREHLRERALRQWRQGNIGRTS